MAPTLAILEQISGLFFVSRWSSRAARLRRSRGREGSRSEMRERMRSSEAHETRQRWVLWGGGEAFGTITVAVAEGGVDEGCGGRREGRGGGVGVVVDGEFAQGQGHAREVRGTLRVDCNLIGFSG
ncbi:hypothetical protein MLD38_036153 [Melastoma candidum]|uniref:Uncharacterized protein n=1 Tax=Melastoma candidum TaxID=119954 RepID=A0ACB9LIU8_9MYRT|nr:hypothetical protein MLD38_036153 [Melastoma candidum]